MDLTPYVPWMRLLHVLGAFMFVAGHGVSMAVAFRLRKERDRARLGALLDLSAGSLTLAGIGLLVLLVSGIVAGIVLGSFGRWWIWLAIGLLVAILVVMTPMGTIHYSKVRAAIGQRTRRLKPTDPDPVPVSDPELDAMLATNRPQTLLYIGGIGFLVILWLMMFRPF